MTSKNGDKFYADAFDIGCSALGVYRGYVVTPETITQITQSEARGPFAATGYGLLFQLTPDFIERIKNGEQQATSLRVFHSSNDQLMLFIRFQAGSSLVGIVLNIAEQEFVDMLEASRKDGSLTFVGYCPTTGELMKTTQMLGSENIERMLRDARRALALSPESQVWELANSAVWVLEEECKSLIPSIAVGNVAVSAMLPSYQHLSAESMVH
ncbi:hypothetical protein [Nitrogeniibacter aestuarii]|uniref:hypothetical protein n=1 Tax=Nitrogeniibacter aestuarii TaxID=2815343 RepID=UPI001E2E2CAC|nr:hypothetical protein [Nitrogeniibacter aestuarii]